VHALHVEGRDAGGHAFERDIAIAGLEAEPAPRTGPLLAALAAATALALAVRGTAASAVPGAAAGARAALATNVRAASRSALLVAGAGCWPGRCRHRSSRCSRCSACLRR
jgi:hypothetical protein